MADWLKNGWQLFVCCCCCRCHLHSLCCCCPSTKTWIRSLWHPKEQPVLQCVLCVCARPRLVSRACAWWAWSGLALGKLCSCLCSVNLVRACAWQGLHTLVDTHHALGARLLSRATLLVHAFPSAGSRAAACPGGGRDAAGHQQPGQAGPRGGDHEAARGANAGVVTGVHTRTSLPVHACLPVQRCRCL